MTVIVDGNPDGLHDSVAIGRVPEDRRPADWTARAAAFSVDVLPGIGVLACALLVGWSARIGGWLWWLCMVVSAAVLLAVALNRLLLPAATGWSLGRSLVGIEVVGRDGRRPGPWQLLVRDLAHLVDTLPMFLGWLWPLIDQRRRTFADVLTRTEVRYSDEPRPDWTKQARIAAAAAAGLAVAIAAIGYLAVHRPQAEATTAREEIALQGPKLVTDILSYTAKTVADDFTRAQSLVTDGYRPELVAQQDAVRKAGPVDNDYWVTDSAVLSASGRQATMLLLLQGQRGVPPAQRFLTASVNVSFDKSDSGQWQVAGLTVLAPPKPEQPAAPPKPPAKSGKPAPPPSGKPAPAPSGKPAPPPSGKPAPPPSGKPAPPPSAKPAPPAKPASPSPQPNGAGR